MKNGNATTNRVQYMNAWAYVCRSDDAVSYKDKNPSNIERKMIPYETALAQIQPCLGIPILSDLPDMVLGNW